MRNVEVFISNGKDANAYRDRALDVLDRLRQLFQFELNYAVTISNWDYRRATPVLVPAGEIAGPSLRVVDRSHALIAIFARSCPEITREEIREVLRRRAAGDRVEVFVFVNPDEKTDEHDEFFDELATSFGEQPVWSPYTDELTFQALMFTAMIRFMIEHLGISNASLIAGAA